MLKLDEKNRAGGPSCGQVRMAEPMTPRTLEALGVPGPVPAATRDFAPDGDWTMTYRVWGGHGWIDCAYKTLGVLRIERIAGSDFAGADFRLGVEQRIVYQGGIVQTLDAQAHCAADTIGSLRQWTLRSEITRTSGEPEPRLGLTYRAEVAEDGRSWRETVGGVRESAAEHALDAPLTGDWVLFEAVQRLAFGPVESAQFNILEGLTMLKRENRLHFRETPEDGLQQQPLPLHRFYRFGRAQLPFDYWVDDDHRVVMAISGSRAYFLEEDPEPLFEATLEQQRQGKGYHG